MSGVAAIFHTDNRPITDGQIDGMLAAMAYRGPEGSETWHRGTVALGHCAFNTCAEDTDAKQPLVSQDGKHVLVMDGYLANYADLRQDLRQRGAGLRNASDAELVMHAYRIWGRDCLAHIDGEFAFIIHDVCKRELFCACDHLGLRQLHYHWDGTTLVAATDISGVLAALPAPPPANLPYLAEHIANAWYTDSETPWRGIMRLPKAHSLHLAAGEPILREYWELRGDVTIRHKSDADYIAHYRAMLTECVIASSRTCAPLACDVSGGLDSSALFCLADKLHKDGALPAPDLLGFTFSAPPGTPADESAFVRAVEEKTGRTITPIDLFCPDLDWFARQGRRDHRLPFLPNTVMGRATAAAAAAKGCRVNLVGQGGDQWLDGHPHHIRQALRMRDWEALGRNLRADVRGLGAMWTLKQIVRQGAVTLLPDPIRAALLRRKERRRSSDEDERADLLTIAMREALEERRKAYERRLAKFAPDDRLKQVKLTSPFASLVYDMMNLQSSQVGIEYRHPMLSRKFIEFSAATPEHIRWRGGVRKFVHREAMRGILPDAIVARQDKAYFDQTFEPHLIEMQKFVLQNLGSKELCQVVEPEAVVEEFTTALGDTIGVTPIWTLWGCYASAAFLQTETAEY